MTDQAENDVLVPRWRALRWDGMMGGARYYVHRGLEWAEDDRGGVRTFASRQSAERHAEALNAAISKATGEAP